MISRAAKLGTCCWGIAALTTDVEACRPLKVKLASIPTKISLRLWSRTFGEVADHLFDLVGGVSQHRLQVDAHDLHVGVRPVVRVLGVLS